MAVLLAGAGGVASALELVADGVASALAFVAAGDAYTYRYDNVTVGIKDHLKIVDDSILWAAEMGELFKKTAEFLTTVGRGGVVLNKKKFNFAKKFYTLRFIYVLLSGYASCF